MSKRPVILIGMAGGLVWAFVIVALGPGLAEILTPEEAVVVALVLGSVPLMAMIGRLAQRRFFDDAIIDGQPLSGGAEIDQRVLTNTVEQLVLAICVWPAAALLLGPGTVLLLGFSNLVARLLFWVGYHLSPPLRGFGFAATFYPTVLAGILSLWTGAQIMLFGYGG